MFAHVDEDGKDWHAPSAVRDATHSADAAAAANIAEHPPAAAIPKPSTNPDADPPWKRLKSLAKSPDQSSRCSEGLVSKSSDDHSDTGLFS